MKKNLLKIAGLTAVLFGVILAVNAETATLQLQITAGSIVCDYSAISGTTVTMNPVTSSFAAQNATGKINAGAVVCTDLEGTTPTWRVTLAAGNLQDANSHTIANTAISASNAGAIPEVSGTCLHFTGNTSLTPIDSAQTILGKNADVGAICILTNSDINLQVAVPANQAVGTYTGTLTFTYQAS
jgi:hypothetical protein